MSDLGAAGKGAIQTLPTKAFMIEMLARDIALERAVLDLLDNCIDGAKRLRPGTPTDFSGLWARITMNAATFVIEDNCGGFSIDIAKNYAFRFGRAKGTMPTPYSIGQFGVGMKRALFKFGRHFTITSTTATEAWKVIVPVDEWEANENDWTLSFDEAKTDMNNSPEIQGTKIVVTQLKPQVSAQFGADYFARQLSNQIRTHLRQFISSGLSIKLNTSYIAATNLAVAVGSTQPSVDEFIYDQPAGAAPVQVRIIAGIANSDPSGAGWYVVCNGRVVLAADRTETTGWGRISEQPAEIPKYHNQFARFRGIVYFDCEDAGRLPWNTTKDGVDADAPVWSLAIEKMIVQTRTVIDFLNQLDKEIDEHGKDGPLQHAVANEPRIEVDTVKGKRSFRPPIIPGPSGPKQVRITYFREATKVQYLMEALGVTKPKEVGEATFDAIYQEQQGE